MGKYHASYKLLRLLLGRDQDRVGRVLRWIAVARAEGRRVGGGGVAFQPLEGDAEAAEGLEDRGLRIR